MYIIYQIFKLSYTFLPKHQKRVRSFNDVGNLSPTENKKKCSGCGYYLDKKVQQDDRKSHDNRVETVR